MTHGLLYALGIILLTMSSFAVSHAQVQLQKQVTPAPLPVVPTAPGPYYALPSWDQKLPSHARFIILSDWGGAAVLDKETGLVWERSPGTNNYSGGWLYALHRCRNFNLGNRKGWRIPMLEELGSLLDMSVPSSPKLPLGHPFMNVQSAPYLSFSETSSGGHLEANFNTGSLTNTGSSPVYLWCVRGPVSGNAK
jgi:hypothetical protein